MSDQQTTDTTAQPNATIDQSGPPPTGGAAQAATFNQEDVNRIVAKRLEEDRARRPAAAPAAKPAPDNAKTPEVNVVAELQELKQRLAFEKRTRGYDLDDKKSEALFKVYQANPEGFEEAVTVFGIKTPQPIASTTNGNTVDPAKTGAAAPVAPVGSVNPMTSGGMIDIFNLSAEQLDQLGPAGLREAYEKNIAIGNQRAGAPPRPRVLQRK